MHWSAIYEALLHAVTWLHKSSRLLDCRSDFVTYLRRHCRGEAARKYRNLRSSMAVLFAQGVFSSRRDPAQSGEITRKIGLLLF